MSKCTCNQGPAAPFQCPVHGCNHDNLQARKETSMERANRLIDEAIEREKERKVLTDDELDDAYESYLDDQMHNYYC